MKQFISFSGGVESSAMCLMYGGTANAIFADTGFEHKMLYKRLPLVEKAVRKFHHNDFEITVVKNQKWESLQEYIKQHKFYPSFKQRFCTRLFKIEPIDNFLKQFKEEGVEIMIGLNCEEADQRKGNHGLLPHVKYSYPLVKNNITRGMCIEILKSAGIYPDFPAYMQRGGCKGCYYKAKAEYEAMLHLSPDEFDDVMKLEEDIQDRKKSFYAIRDSIPQGMRKFKAGIKAQRKMFDPRDGYAVVNDATRCGVFCNR